MTRWLYPPKASLVVAIAMHAVMELAVVRWPL
jgi:hypothetical protein